MNKTMIKPILIGTVIIIAGCFLGHFIGGFLAGAAAFGITIVTAGKIALEKAESRLNKGVRDIILNRKDN